GDSARQYCEQIQVGMVGVNVPIPVPMAFHSFGGWKRSLFGALLGALVVNYLKTVLTGAMPDAWLFLLGGLFVVVTMALPRGIAGVLAWRRRQEGAT
ncbi:aldehyde dehydrogenase family protein, partial [Salinicola endophyticus]|uniref:aldehyde dehydrogenase family protein n=1 Tax=Salinicola endophyticus TaxID=1949083 RepID=UPI00249A7B5A